MSVVIANRQTAPVLISIEQVRKSYQLGETVVHALRGVDLTILQGEFTTVVGQSGSGKSTLLNLIGCLDDPDAGSIVIDGVNVAGLSSDAKSDLRNQKIGFIFQSFNLIPVLSVRENIELPLILRKDLTPAERRERVKSALADVGLTQFTNYLPDKLSGGQRQRVAIARALVPEPSLVLADEPTANLDSETAQRILDLMLDINAKRKVTFVFSSHDEKLIQRTTRVVRLKDGVIL